MNFSSIIHTATKRPRKTTKDFEMNDESMSAGRKMFLLRVHLRNGCDLAPKDSSGTSDPYVKFQHKGKTLFKSRTVYKNLNPEWDQQFEFMLDDVSSPLHIEVFDYDRIGKNDFIGATDIDLSYLEMTKSENYDAVLYDKDKTTGTINFGATLSPLSPEEHKQLQQQLSSDSTSSTTTPRRRFRMEGKNFWSPGAHKSKLILPDFFVRLRFGADKRKSKCSKSLDPKWSEQFQFWTGSLDQILEVTAYDRRRDQAVGRFCIKVKDLSLNTTHNNWYNFENATGKVLMLITISPRRMPSNSTWTEAQSYDSAEIAERYKFTHTIENMSDVGFLAVKVIKAEGLMAADIGSKSDPFCVLELVNNRLCTHTLYKTLDPEWNQTFTFNIKDAHSVLEVTVFDEDQNSDPEFLGKVAIPLSRIHNGEQRWYALKGCHLNKRSKGEILLEMTMTWNPVRAAYRTFRPKEQKYLARSPRFQRQQFLRNLMRLKRFAMPLQNFHAFVLRCFTWDDPMTSALAFLVFLIVTYYWRMYMTPLALLACIGVLYYLKKVRPTSKDICLTETCIESEEEEEEEDLIDTKNSSLKERWRELQAALLQMQDSLDFAAGAVERLRNLCLFTQPFLSWLAIIILVVSAVLLFFIPFRYLFMAWGINKFTKRFRKGRHHIPNNEILDFFSRIFNDKELRHYGEFHLLQRPTYER